MSILSKEKNQVYRVVGVSFPNDDGTSRQENLSKVGKLSLITLVREPKNKFDSNAVAVYADKKQVGYLGNYYASIIAPKLDKGEKFIVKVNDCGIYNNKYYLNITINPLGV